MMMHYAEDSLLVLAAAIPFACFVALAIGGARLRKPLAGWVAVAGITASTLLASLVLYQWLGLGRHDVARTLEWARVGGLPITVGVQLDALTVILFFMVCVVSACIFLFSIGYMAGTSDQVDGRSLHHRFFAFLCLFAFSMLALVLSSSFLQMFIFWELVGFCSYLLIGFHFHRRSAGNAAIKAFVVNRVGDFGFFVGLMMVAAYLGDLSISGAAVAFAAQHADGGPLFVESFLGVSLATWLGLLLFGGAIAKSAQFPLHVWLPDAMEGPTPVSALIHAATMVAAGVFLVARVFLLLTPAAQTVIAVVGTVTLTLGALVAIVQTDIKRVLAYSTISQLGYMIFALGVGAWIGALFHLLTHAFFKAMLFLGSGQVIEGCAHEQDMRKMGGLARKMPVTAVTFLIGVLAIAGVGIPGMGLGLGGYFSKDEILAVACHRAFGTDGAIASSLGVVLFGVAVVIAYVTPFYMMRCWWMTFMGQPRDADVHAHAHERPLMFVPLLVLAVGTVAAGYWLFRPMVAQAAPYGVLVATFDPYAHGDAAARDAWEHAHHALVPLVGFAFAIGFAVAIVIYARGLALAERLRWRLRPLHTLLIHKFYIDEIYAAIFVGGILAARSLCGWVDTYVVDGVVNAVGRLTQRLAQVSGMGLDRDGAAGSSAAPGEPPAGRGLGFLTCLMVAAVTTSLMLDGAYLAALAVLLAAWAVLGIDGMVNDLGRGALAFADAVRRPQTGRIRDYVLLAVGSVAVVLLVWVLA
ncbi:MAG: NADH-quinone oxidoreductase subunit L [Phycisphaerae bacterium]|nr:NADH-quinone oxidoreductase subunit L [Phycisphaerae bacterium]